MRNILKTSLKNKSLFKTFSIAFVALLLTVQYAFSQTNLAFYINAATQNSPLIADVKNQNKANQFEVDRLKAFYTKPQVAITANYLFAPIVSTDDNKTKLQLNSQGADKYFGYDLGATNGGQYQALLGVTQPLYNGQRLQTIAEQFNITNQVNENNAKLTAHDIEKIITDQYILCLQDIKLTQYAEAMVKLLAEQKDVLRKLVEATIYKQSDLTLINIEYQNFLGQLANCKANYRRDLLDLKVLAAINDTSVTLQNTELTPTASLENSAFIEKYKIDSLSLLNQQKLFELKYKPQVFAFANTGLNATYIGDLPRRLGVSGGISLVYNLFDGNQKNINKSKVNIQLKSLTTYKDNFETQNNIRKAKLLQELASYAERISIAEQQMQEYKTLLVAYKKEIVAGQLSIINYITTLKNMAMVQRDYTLLFSQKQSIINAYNYWNW